MLNGIVQEIFQSEMQNERKLIIVEKNLKFIFCFLIPDSV